MIDRHRLDRALRPPLDPKLERRMWCAVRGARPPRADRSLRADDVEVLVILERGQRLRDHRVRLAGEAEDRGDVVGEAGAALGVAEREDRARVADAVEVPGDEVEDVHGLLEQPRADARGIVAPGLRARTEREAKERE